jgi:hypothetical protein
MCLYSNNNLNILTILDTRYFNLEIWDLKWGILFSTLDKQTLVYILNTLLSYIAESIGCVHSVIFDRILFKFAETIVRLTISVKDYVHSCSRTARTRKNARLRERAWLSIRLTMDRFSSNFLWTYYTSQQVARETYSSCPSTACWRASVCASARVFKLSLIF